MVRPFEGAQPIEYRQSLYMKSLFLYDSLTQELPLDSEGGAVLEYFVKQMKIFISCRHMCCH